MKRLLSGNEAIALGAWEAGVHFASAYPGTPSTEILEALAQYAGVKAEWAANEKVALDAAAGASFAGARALAAMKHVGVNVAADSLMSLSYTGVGGGLVLVSADDPGAFSSQNEQDNRQYARFGKFPCLDPSDSQEAKGFVAVAFDISERFDTPVLLRSTTRLSHSKGAVEVEPPDQARAEPEPLGRFEKHPDKYVIIPAHARRRHPEVEERLARLAEYAETSPLNRIEWGDKSIGIVTCGMAYQYAREVFAGYSFLKLGLTYPIPENMIRDFAAQVDTLLVIEELDPFFEDQIKAMGIEVKGKELFPITGELTLSRVRAGALKGGFSVDAAPKVAEPAELDIPPRPPALCPGCPHRSVYYSIRRRKLISAGDIGCYSIGVLPPFDAMDVLISMGASVGMAHGMKQAGLDQKVVATIGDSTFFHAGLSPLASTVYNRGVTTTIILDNGITAMTGGQENPATGVTLQGDVSRSIDIESVVRGMGVKDVWVVDALDVEAVDTAIREATAIEDRPTVIIVNGACVFTRQYKPKATVRVDPELCIACGTCLRVGCPAVLKSDEIFVKTGRQKSMIDELLCVGCEVCLQVCPQSAIYRTSEEGQA